MKKIFNKTYKAIVCTTFIIIMLLINYNNFFKIEKTEKIMLLALILFGVLFIINKFIINKIKDSCIKVLNIINLIIILILEIVSVIYFRVEYNWDFKYVMEGALQLATTSTTEHLHYFQVFPNNTGSLIIVTIAMKLFGNREIGAYILNVVLVFITAIITTLISKKIGGQKLAWNTSLMLILCIPFYLYTPIVYSDTLSVLIPVINVYLWILFKDTEKKSLKWIYMLLIVVTAFIGYIIKPVAAIALIAIIIEIIFSKFREMKYFGISLIIFMCMIILYNNMMYKYFLNIEKENKEVFPYTHWIMMGMSKPTEEGGTSIGWGAYNYYDVIYTEGQNTYNKKVEANVSRIKERLNEFGIRGYINFLLNKTIYIWNDGTYYIQAKLKWSPLNTETKIYSIVFGDDSEKFVTPHFTAFHIILMMMILIGALKDLFKERNQETRILEMTIVGIFIFLLFWEARSRYIYILIPVFCILGAKGLKDISNFKIKDTFCKKKGLDEKNEKNISNNTNVL